MPEKGLLALGVELSTRNTTAGADFAIYVSVRNPFAEPVWIHEVNVTLPTDLELSREKNPKEETPHLPNPEEKRQLEHLAADRQIEGELKALRASVEAFGNKESLPAEEQNSAKEFLRRSNSVLRDIELREQREHDSYTAIHVRGGAKIDRFIVSSSSAKISIDGDGAAAAVGNLIVQDTTALARMRERTVRLRSSLPENAALQAASTGLCTAVIRANKSILFTPTIYRLQFYVNYGFVQPIELQAGVAAPGGEVHTNSVAYDLAMRAPIHSIMLGAVVGGLSGSVARMLQLKTSVAVFDAGSAIFLSALLSAVAVVFLARKTEAQSFVSVEDFWGGVMMGFLIGYSGTSFFERITGAKAGS